MGGRGYRDIWMIIVTGLLLFALISIQDQRADAVRASCQSSNSRNADTKAELDDLIAKLPPGPRRERAKANKAGTVLLIDALSPKRNCEKLVKETVGDGLFW